MRMRLSDRTLFVDLAALADAVVAGANILAELVGGDDASRRQVGKGLSDCEARGDELTHAVMSRLNSTFITPFDRQDVYALASALDDCLDHLNAAGEMICLLRLGDLPQPTLDLVSILVRQAELTAQAMRRLGRLRDLADFWVEVNRLENEADRTSRRLIADVLNRSTDLNTALRLREVIHRLDDAANAFERVAHTVEALAVKEA